VGRREFPDNRANSVGASMRDVFDESHGLENHKPKKNLLLLGGEFRDDREAVSEWDVLFSNGVDRTLPGLSQCGNCLIHALSCSQFLIGIATISAKLCLLESFITFIRTYFHSPSGIQHSHKLSTILSESGTPYQVNRIQLEFNSILLFIIPSFHN
jgi:hypothetical protein